MSKYEISKMSNEYDCSAIVKERIQSYHDFGWEILPDGDSVGINVCYFELFGTAGNKCALYSSDAVPYIIESMARVTAGSYPEEIPALTEAMIRSVNDIQKMSKSNEADRIIIIRQLMDCLRSLPAEAIINSAKMLHESLNELELLIGRIRKMTEG